MPPPPPSAPRVSSLAPLTLPGPLARAGAAAWIVLVGTVIFLSLSPDHGPPGGLHIDKAAHAAAYAVLAAMPFAVVGTARWTYAAAALTLPMGFGLEFAQDFIPTRSADAADALANVLGVAVGARLGPMLRACVNRWFGTKGRNGP